LKAMENSMEKNIKRTKSVVKLTNETRDEKEKRVQDLQRAQDERISNLVNKRVNNIHLKETLQQNRAYVQN
jgi:hypothetical protein